MSINTIGDVNYLYVDGGAQNNDIPGFNRYVSVDMKQ